MERLDPLAYGIVVERLDSGEWWHGHIVRSDLKYHSAWLGKRTGLLFLMVMFGSGATRKSADFYLTLDAEGIPEELLPLGYKGGWGERDDELKLKTEALYIQNQILPALFDSGQFQSAMAAIVRSQAYEKMADAKRFCRIDGVP